MGNISAGPATLWFRTFQQVAAPRLRLVCFAHAGGAASAFRLWHKELPGDIEVLGVQYPGRQDRLLEDPVEHMDVLVDAISAAFPPLLTGPVAFFGHSMGASVAHEVAVQLEQRYDHPLTRLFVSARPAPHRLLPDERHLFSDEYLAKELHRLGGADADLADDPEMRELIMPAVRADFTLVANYGPQSSIRTVGAPIDAFAGTHDPEASGEDMRHWADVTRSGFACRTFSGDHFYLQQRRTELLRHIAERLS